MTDPATGHTPKPTFEERMEGFGRDVEAAGERFGREADAAGKRFGREAEAAGKRLAKDPSVTRAADTAARVWGFIVLAVGVWFLADFTFGVDMPVVPWGDIWPVGLIVIGLFVVVRGMSRSRA